MVIMFNRIDVVKLFLEDGRIDPSSKDNRVICSAASCGRLEMVDLLLKDVRVDPTVKQNDAINRAASLQHFAVVDRLLLDSRIDSMSPDMPCFTDIRMIRSRMSQAAMALQDLCIPALVLLEILDALLPNDIPMYKKWSVIVAVKHFVRLVE